MKQILPKNKERQIAIVEMLSIAPNGLSLQQLADQCKCSKRTVTVDLKDLDQMHDFMAIGYINDRYILKFNEGTNIQNFYRDVLQEEPLFKLFEVIFFQPNLDVVGLAEKLFISESSLYRAIPKINRALQEHFDISMETNPMQLTGDESKIRGFFSQYFVEKYDKSQWPFERYMTEESYNEFLKYCLSYIQVFFGDYNFAFIRSVR